MVKKIKGFSPFSLCVALFLFLLLRLILCRALVVRGCVLWRRLTLR